MSKSTLIVFGRRTSVEAISNVLIRANGVVPLGRCRELKKLARGENKTRWCQLLHRNQSHLCDVIAPMEDKMLSKPSVYYEEQESTLNSVSQGLRHLADARIVAFNSLAGL
jgi:hypothetical protein